MQHVAFINLGSMKLEIHPSRKAAGIAAALAAAEALRRLAKVRDRIGIIFATGASQIDMLEELTSIPDLPWNRVLGFHMDEYVRLDENHPASFRRYMRERLTSRVPMRAFFELNGNAEDIASFSAGYMQSFTAADPQLCLLGIGENGHLAFNDPAEADFSDPLPIKVVSLDDACRQQQVSEGWFPTREDVPRQALTLTIPTLLRIPKLIATVPGARKATAVHRTIEDPISTACPTTILRTHPDVTLYLDPESATDLNMAHQSR